MAPPKLRHQEISECLNCGRSFEWTWLPSRPVRNYCSRRCQALYVKPLPPPKHGESQSNGTGGSPTWITWHNMVQRCTDPKASNWKYYGGRGITVCDRWREYLNFKIDMGERPEGMTLDRFPDHNGNYEPGNCRWATPKQQTANRRPIEHEQRTHCFKGHDLAVVGFYTYPTGRRECRECRMRTQLKHRDRKNAARRERNRMKKLRDTLTLFHKSEQAQDLVEYSVICLVLALGCIAGMSTLAGSLNAEFVKIAGKLT